MCIAFALAIKICQLLLKFLLLEDGVLHPFFTDIKFTRWKSQGGDARSSSTPSVTHASKVLPTLPINSGVVSHSLPLEPNKFGFLRQMRNTTSLGTDLSRFMATVLDILMSWSWGETLTDGLR